MTPRGETGNDFGVRPTAEGSATVLPRVAPCTDGTAPWWFQCAVCQRWGRITQEQYEGLVSINHAAWSVNAPNPCTFHDRVRCFDLPHVDELEAAVGQHLNAVRNDVAFRQRLAERMKVDASLLERMAAEPPKPKAEDPTQ